MTTIDVMPRYVATRPMQGRRGKAEDVFSTRGRVIWGIIFALFVIVGVGGWSATAKLSGAIIGTGSVLVDENLKVVQHIDGGVVREIGVRVGDTVAAGQVLFRLDDVQILAERGIINDEMAELLARRSRLSAERDGKSSVEFPPDFFERYPDAEAIADGERRLFDGNRINLESREQQLRLQVAQIEQGVGGMVFRQIAIQAELDSTIEEQSRVRPLTQKGLVVSARLTALDRDIARLQGQAGEIDANLEQNRAHMREVELQILALRQTIQTDTQRELRDVQGKLAELTNRLRAVDERLARTEIRAPVSGVVNELMVSTLGGVITPAERLLTIVPVNARLKIEFHIAPKDIDQIAIDQPAKLRFSAFNQRTTPEIDGRIVRISAAAQRDPQTGENYYTGEVAVTGDVSVFGERGLVPGMPVEVFVQTAELTAIAYLTKPFTDQINRTFKEE